jgi:putative SOS response-associated peptidase YedK
MCGRYTHKLTWQQIVNLYRLTLPEDEPAGLRQSYNVAPTDVMPIIRPSGNGRELVMAGWGLVPFWLKPDQLGKQPYSMPQPPQVADAAPAHATAATSCRRRSGRAVSNGI